MRARGVHFLRPQKAYANTSACWNVSIAVVCFLQWISEAVVIAFANLMADIYEAT